MMPKINYKLFLGVLFCTLLTCTFWTILFNKHAIIGEVVWDINAIFTSVICFYIVVKISISNRYIDLIKIFIRIIFRVWLLIFITFSMYKGTERVAFLLSISFIFGYFEGLIDIDAWLKNGTVTSSKFAVLNTIMAHKLSASILFINCIHFFCAIILWLFFRYY